MESSRPFHETLTGLLEVMDIGQRELARRTALHGWGSHTTIGRLTQNELKPSLQAMEQIAYALGVPPETFAEYRLGKARAKLDPAQVGLKAALKNLARCTDL